MNRRTLVLGLALAVSLAWTAWTLVADEDHDVVGAAVRPAAQRPARLAGAADKTGRARAGDANLALELPQRPAPGRRGHNLFGAYNYDPPPAPVAAAPPQAPQAPPLPFKFAGFLLDGNQATYWFLRNRETIDAQIGTHIGEFTLIEADRSRLVFLHEPTGQKVPMPIPAATAETAKAD